MDGIAARSVDQWQIRAKMKTMAFGHDRFVAHICAIFTVHPP